VERVDPNALDWGPVGESVLRSTRSTSAAIDPSHLTTALTTSSGIAVLWRTLSIVLP
jgi:hypothetical protein